MKDNFFVFDSWFCEFFGGGFEYRRRVRKVDDDLVRIRVIFNFV